MSPSFTSGHRGGREGNFRRREEAWRRRRRPVHSTRHATRPLCERFREGEAVEQAGSVFSGGAATPRQRRRAPASRQRAARPYGKVNVRKQRTALLFGSLFHEGANNIVVLVENLDVLCHSFAFVSRHNPNFTIGPSPLLTPRVPPRRSASCPAAPA